nr:hypothetical protein [Angustibacter aerolatus]
MLSLALTGFIWQAHLQPRPGPAERGAGQDRRERDRLVRRLERQPVGGAVRGRLEAHRLHHAAVPGGPEGVDPALREAAAMDGASQTKTFFRVVFPVMRPINIVVIVVTVIESLRAFDLVWVINKGRNGLEPDRHAGVQQHRG